jgi:hypothetical protein
MVSDDFGKTWHRSDGSLVPMPTTAETIEVLDSGGVDSGRILRAGAMAVDAEGAAHVVYSFDEDAGGDTVLAASQGDGRWQRRRLAPYLPDPSVAHWLPNIEKPTGHNRLPERPGIIYTAGPPGQKNTDILCNGVYWFG